MMMSGRLLGGRPPKKRGGIAIRVQAKLAAQPAVCCTAVPPLLYLRLLNIASGPETVLGGLDGPLLAQSPLEKVGGFATPTFSNGFYARRGPFRQTWTMSDLEAL